MDFGQSLRAFRTAAGLGLRQLAREVGVSPAYLSLVETGKAPPPSPSRALQIAKALDMPPETLVTLTGRVDPEVLNTLTELPETGELVRAAARAGLKSFEISALAAALSRRGRRVLEALRACDGGGEESGKNPKSLVDRLAPSMVFPALSCRTRGDLFGFLAGEVNRSRPELDSVEVLSALEERESGNSTAFSDGIAIPHARLKGLSEAVLALGRSPSGIAYQGLGSEPVRLVFMLLSPAEGPAHLENLGLIAKACSRPSTREGLLRAKGKRGMLKAFKEALGGSGHAGEGR